MGLLTHRRHHCYPPALAELQDGLRWTCAECGTNWRLEKDPSPTPGVTPAEQPRHPPTGGRWVRDFDSAR